MLDMTPELIGKSSLKALLLAVLLISLTGCQGEEPPGDEPSEQPEETEEITPPQVEEESNEDPSAPVLIEIDLGNQPVSLDPLDISALNHPTAYDLFENLFIGLTRINPDDNSVSPAFARDWDVADDGFTWTIYLRDDVYWVTINPDSGVMERVRPVTSDDVLFAIERACINGPQTVYFQAVGLVDGCREVSRQPNSGLTDEFISQTLGARVLNDVAIEIRLTQKLDSFPNILSMPVFSPLPRERVEDNDTWPDISSLITSGSYTLQPGGTYAGGLTLVINQFWPFEREGNVDILRVDFSGDDEAFSRWEEGEVLFAPIPPSEISSVPLGENASYRILAQNATSFLTFSYEVTPFDKPEIRRAFALAIDREELVQSILIPAGFTALPADQLTPPGTPDVPDYGSTELAYDPELAREILASAGHASCSGIPNTTILTDESDLSADLAEAYIQMWTRELDCPEGLFTIEQRPFQQVLFALRNSPDLLQPDRPAIISLGWAGDYFDTQHWMADILGCKGEFALAYLDQGRECGQIDTDILRARLILDPAERSEIYSTLMDDLFSPEGEMPLIPISFWGRGVAISPELVVFPLHAGPLQFDRWVSLDNE